jgi:hypothetical protein
MGTKSGRIIAALIFGGCVTWCAPVRADEASDLDARLQTAAATVRTSQTTMTGRPGQADMFIVTTMAAPDRFKQEMTVGKQTMSFYGVDGFFYLHETSASSPDSPWAKFAFDKTKTEMYARQLILNRQVKLLPDVIEDGVALGMFEATATFANDAIASRVETTTCSYDKQTYLKKRCTSATSTTTYSRYNDPSLVIELPPEAKNAVLMPTPNFPDLSPPKP